MPDLAQSMAALERANEIRKAHADLKGRMARCKNLGASVRRAMTVVADPPDYAESLAVEKLLKACRGFGPIRSRRTLSLLHISPTRTLGGLAAGERVRLIVELDQVVRRWEASRVHRERRRDLVEQSSEVAA